MIRKYLGRTVDIHGGGSDLVFPHHENELAQSEAANSAPLARFWLHNGMINTDSEKMSKSEGNFFEVRELAEKYGYEALRFYLLGFHYRSPINFAPEHVEAAKSAVTRIRNCVKMLKAAKERGDNGEAYEQRFYKALDDDFNTADAIGVIFELVKHANNTRDASLLPVLNKITGILGFDFSVALDDVDGIDDIEHIAHIEILLQARAVARSQKDWKQSDKIRDELKKLGVAVVDSKDGQKWHYGTN
jgi:cysteinyl-tRNA synthetase